MLEELKQHLRIFDGEEDRYLVKVINRNKAYFNGITGLEIDFEKDLQAQSLLLERCRYDFNNALDEFETNFAPSLRRLILLSAIGKEADPIEELPGDVQ